MLKSQPLTYGSVRMKVTGAHLLPPLWVFICHVGFNGHGCPSSFSTDPFPYSEQRPRRPHLMRSYSKLLSFLFNVCGNNTG